MSRGTKTVLFVFSVVVLTMIAVYLGICVYFNNRFFPGSVINGMDVSGKSVEEAEELVAVPVLPVQEAEEAELQEVLLQHRLTPVPRAPTAARASQR